MNQFYSFSQRAVLFLSLLIAGLLTVSSLFITAYSFDMVSQEVMYRFDNIISTVITIPLLLVLCSLFLKGFCSKNSVRRIDLLEVFTLILYFVAGTALIVFGRTNPAADAMSVYVGGKYIAMNDFSIFTGSSSYFSYYPFQIGLSFLEAPFHKLWSLLPILNRYEAYHGMKVVYVILTMIIVHLFRRITDMIWHSEKTTAVGLLFLLTNLPLIVYSSFVYGEIPGLCLFLAGLFFVLKYRKDTGYRRWLEFFLSVISFGLSVVVRKNSLILIIAITIVLIYEAFHRRNYSLALLAAVTILCSWIFPKVVINYCEQKAECDIPRGVTSLSYVAMGMQEASRGAGWYNGFNFITYQDANLDPLKANQVSTEAIRQRLTEFMEEPGYALDFYWRKFTSLWCDGTYACRQATLSEEGGRNTLLRDFYSGSKQVYVVDFCNIWQNLLYLGLFAYVLASLFSGNAKRREIHFEDLVFIIAMIGGFLFHLIWEANSRYIFTYAMLLIPVSAHGLVDLVSCIQSKGRSQTDEKG